MNTIMFLLIAPAFKRGGCCRHNIVRFVNNPHDPDSFVDADCKTVTEVYFKEQKINTPFRILFSQVDSRRKMHKEMVAYFLEKKSKAICVNNVPVMSDIEKMGLVRAPIASFAPTHRAAKIYEGLFLEVVDCFLDKKLKSIAN